MGVTSPSGRLQLVSEVEVTDMDRKRSFVSDLYDGPGWKAKVKRMPDAQVIAIYLHEQDKQEQEKKDRKDKESGSDEFPF